jgi:hypothetical protein
MFRDPDSDSVDPDPGRPDRSLNKERGRLLWSLHYTCFLLFRCFDPLFRLSFFIIFDKQTMDWFWFQIRIGSVIPCWITMVLVNL